MKAMACAMILFLSAGADSNAQSPYAGQHQRQIKALSSSEIDGYLGGKGMGYAKAAELNRYPGPKHVLELADVLDLSDGQRADTQALFESMKRHAMRLGRDLIAKENELDAAFAARTITPDRLDQLVGEIAELQGSIRLAHLKTHLQQRAILDPGQVARYMHLRGYGDAHQGH